MKSLEIIEKLKSPMFSVKCISNTWFAFFLFALFNLKNQEKFQEFLANIFYIVLIRLKKNNQHLLRMVLKDKY